jgi:putative phosphoribosyl transferase
MRFLDRLHAGDVLAAVVAETAPDLVNPIVLGLPRGGVPVAARVAAVLDAPLDVFVVRKLGAPGHRELAIGAIASGGVLIVNDNILQHLGLSQADVDAAVAAESDELRRREKTYRGDRPPLVLADRDVLIVDDGVATGASLKAACAAVQEASPRSVIVAVPVAPIATASDFAEMVDRFIVCRTPEPFGAVGSWYRDFTQTTDDEVQVLLSAER